MLSLGYVIYLQTKKKKKKKSSWFQSQDGYPIWSSGFVASAPEKEKAIDRLMYVTQKIQIKER